MPLLVIASAAALAFEASLPTLSVKKNQTRCWWRRGLICGRVIAKPSFLVGNIETPQGPQWGVEKSSSQTIVL